MPSYPEGYTSYEDWIDHMSGCDDLGLSDDDAAPHRAWVKQYAPRARRDWPMPDSAPTTPPDDEGEAEPHES